MTNDAILENSRIFKRGKVAFRPLALRSGELFVMFSVKRGEVLYDIGFISLFRLDWIFDILS